MEGVEEDVEEDQGRVEGAEEAEGGWAALGVASTRWGTLGCVVSTEVIVEKVILIRNQMLGIKNLILGV